MSLPRIFLIIVTACILPTRFALADDYLARASQSIEAQDKAGAHFWVARHLISQKFTMDPQTNEVLKKMRLEPKGFFPTSWPPFISTWFTERSRSMWPSDFTRIHEKSRRIEVASVSEGGYFATLTVVPEVQAWYSIHEGVSTDRSILLAGAGKPSPTLVFGRHIKATETSEASFTQSIYSLRALHHASLSFKDCDGDGQKELIVHLTWIVSNSFRQTARIYRVLSQARLELWKTLDAPAGYFLAVGDGGSQTQIPAEKVDSPDSPYLAQ